jgi:hypothetical protein
VNVILSAVLSVALAAAIAVAGYAGPWIAVGAGVLCVVVLAIGWPDLLRLPDRIGSTLLVGLTGVAALVVAEVSPATAVDPSRPLSTFAAVLAVALLLAFVHELVRQDGRHDLVESLTGTFTGQVIAILAAGWVLLVRVPDGQDGVLIGAAAVALGRLVTLLPIPEPAAPWAGVVGAGLAAMAAAVVLGSVAPAKGLVVGACVGGVAAAVDRLLSANSLAPAPLDDDVLATTHPGSNPHLLHPHLQVPPHAPQPLPPAPPPPSRLAMFAAAAAPVAAAGTVAYAFLQFSPA